MGKLCNVIYQAAAHIVVILDGFNGIRRGATIKSREVGVVAIRSRHVLSW